MNGVRNVGYFGAFVLLLFSTIAAKKLPERYNPYRANGTLKQVIIKIEWDNPDLPPDVREKMRKRNLITLNAKPQEVTLARGDKTRKITLDEYLDLWKLMRKVRVWKLDSNALSSPHPLGVSIRIFSLKMEGAGEKYFNVDVPNKRSRKHFLILNAIYKLCNNYLLH